MLQPATLKFLKNLAKNNNREWFELHKEAYAAARKDFEAFVAQVMQAMLPVEPRLGEQEAKDTMFRIFRDVRFSKDKTPYKVHFSSYMSRMGKKWEGAGYYLHVSDGNIFLAAGIWMPQGALMKALRQEIDYSYEELQGILEDKKFRKYFPVLDTKDQLKKVAPGYDAAHPAADLLKLKSIIAIHQLKEEDLLSKDAVKKVVTPFTLAKPLVEFCNRAFDS